MMKLNRKSSPYCNSMLNAVDVIFLLYNRAISERITFQIALSIVFFQSQFNDSCPILIDAIMNCFYVNVLVFTVIWIQISNFSVQNISFTLTQI